MKTEQILEGNTLIAEFMNEKLDPSRIISDKTEGKNLWVELAKRELGTDIPPYDKSWDWLMPVVVKIESMGGDECEFDIFGNCVQVGDVGEYVGKTKIEATWKGVIDFIRSVGKK